MTGRASLFLLSMLCVVSCTQCVNTDEPSDNTFTPYMPDQGVEDAPDQGAAMDMARDASSPGDLGGEGDLDLGRGDGGDEVDLGVEMGVDPVICRPNQDGVITRQEVPLRAGLSATYSVATDVASVSTAGSDNGDGTRTWDLSGVIPGEARVIVEARDPKGQWFSTDFPQATYMTQLSQSSALLGLFEITQEELRLLGVASPESGFYETNVEYDPAVRTLAFPLEVGKSWEDSASVTGKFNGAFVSYSEEYSSQVDARGTLKTPYGDFEVLRVRVELERTVGFLTTRTRSYLFVSECFGTVGTIVSEDDEDEVEFTSAAEVRRLAR